MTSSNYIYDESLLDEQRAVARIEINGEDWFMDYEDYKLAQDEGRTKPVIYGDSLILVDDETYLELEKLIGWLDGNK